MYSVHGAIRHHSLTHAHTPEQHTPKSLFLMAPTEPKTQPNRNTHSHISTVSRIQTISTIQTDPTINYVWRIEKKRKTIIEKLMVSFVVSLIAKGINGCEHQAIAIKHTHSYMCIEPTEEKRREKYKSLPFVGLLFTLAHHLCLLV